MDQWQLPVAQNSWWCPWAGPAPGQSQWSQPPTRTVPGRNRAPQAGQLSGIQSGHQSGRLV